MLGEGTAITEYLLYCKPALLCKVPMNSIDKSFVFFSTHIVYHLYRQMLEVLHIISALDNLTVVYYCSSLSQFF